MVYVLDIETVGHERAADWMTDRKPPPSYSKPETIEKWRGEQVAKAAVKVPYLRVVAVAIAALTSTTPPEARTWADFQDEPGTNPDGWERALLLWTWRVVHRDGLLGFCLRTFDGPALWFRSMVHELTVPPYSWDRYPRPQAGLDCAVVDLADILTCNGNTELASLRQYGRAFGLSVEDPITGADIPALVAAGRWTDVESHAVADVTLTRALAHALHRAVTRTPPVRYVIPAF